MLDKALEFVAPHYCCGCDKIGVLLCGNCKNNIISEPKMFCAVCGCLTGNMWLCGSCRVPAKRAWAAAVVRQRLKQSNPRFSLCLL